MIKTLALLRWLADGELHSAAELGAQLGLPASEIANLAVSARELGVQVVALDNQHYQLSAALELLDAEQLSSAIKTPQRARLAAIDIQQQIDSTNLYLLHRADQGAVSGTACFAEYQSAGRGRLGRQWVSPFACNIYLSLLWRFACATQLAGLSQAMAVTLSRALSRLGLSHIGLKWPNDVLCQNRKLAGILIDMKTRADGSRHAVIGIGLNVAMPAESGAAIKRPWIALHELLGKHLSRNLVGGVLLDELLIALPQFERDGWSAFAPEWAARDYLHGQSITLHTATGSHSGQATGIAPDGALILADHGRLRHYQDGEASLSPAASAIQPGQAGSD